jgi:lipopolysaccharide export system permease protein
MWYVNRYSKATGKAYGVTVYRRDTAGRELSRILATDGVRQPGGGWLFTGGRLLTFDPESGVPETDRPFASLAVPEFDEDPQLMLLLGQKPGALSFFGLQQVLRFYALDADPKALPYAVRYYGVLASTLAPLIVIAIAIPFAISGVRVNPAVGVSKSLGLFILYYLLDNLAVALATKGVLQPDVAAWIPNASLGLLAVYLFAKLR